MTALAPAVVYHALEVHIFRKSGPHSWHSVTGARGVFLSTDSPTSSTGNVVAKYLSNAEASGGLPFETHRLLVPHLAAGMAPDDLPPHMKNGARDYIVVPNHLLSLADTECSKIGAYFRAFSNQDERCQRQIGSCLEMQPLDMWSQDDWLSKVMAVVPSRPGVCLSGPRVTASATWTAGACA